MTIHKAKGLEFDTVIVPGLDRAPGRSDPPLILWKQSLFSPLAGEGPGERGLLLAPIKETGARDERVYDYLKALERDAEDTEAGRLLYVAATRAKSRIHMLGCVKQEDEGTLRAPAKRSLLAKVWPFTSVLPLSRAAGEGPGVRAGGGDDLLRRLPTIFAPPAFPDAVHWHARDDGRAAEPEIEFSWVGETARHVGSVVHRWLQRIAEDDLRGWDAKRVDSLRPRFTRELEGRGVPPRELRPATDLVATALKNTLGDDRGRWVLGPHPEARSEYRIRTATRSYVIDRVLRDKEGNRWTVDYKTSRHEGANVEAFLDEERNRYAAQLDAYATALGDARRGLYFPLHAGWRAW